MLLPVAVATAVISVVSALASPDRPPPVSVFADLDGVWAGTFVGYDTTGRELYRIRARHTYRTISETRKSVEIEDILPDGSVVTGRGANVARRAGDGSLELRCLVSKSNGDHVEHKGTVVRGPDGDEQIVWHTSTTGRVETFREVVRREGAETIYEINGLGRYGETLILMTGRYRRVQESGVRSQESADP